MELLSCDCQRPCCTDGSSREISFRFWSFPLRDQAKNTPKSSSSSPSNFAHITDALSGALKPDVMLGNLQSNLKNSHNSDSELDILRRSKFFDSYKIELQQVVKLQNAIVAGDFSNTFSGIRELSNKGTPEDLLAPQLDLTKHSSVIKLDAENTQAPALERSMSITSFEAPITSQRIKQSKDQDWEYAISSEPLPSMFFTISSLQTQKLKSSYEVCLANGNKQPASCKLTLRKLPLKVLHTKSSKMSKVSKEDKKIQWNKKAITVINKCKLRNAHVLKQLLCGGFAGVISRTAVAPLDLVKTYLITSHGLPGPQKSALEITKDILSSSGWQGLFRGNLVNCIRVAPNKAIELCVFETVRRELNKEGHPLRHLAATIAGGAAGMAGTAATYPLELVRTRLSVQPELYTGLFQAVTRIIKEEGYAAFYAGLTPSMVGVFPYAATNYFVYDGLRTAYSKSTGQHNVPIVPTLAFGALAAAASSTVTYPLEVARRQMQLCVASAARKTTLGIIMDIYTREGFLALYRGLGTTWLKLIPAAGISFVCYEAARLALHIDEASCIAKAAAEKEESHHSS